MYSSEIEPLIFEVSDQARNCFIIKAMCAWNTEEDQVLINLVELPMRLSLGFFSLQEIIMIQAWLENTVSYLSLYDPRPGNGD